MLFLCIFLNFSPFVFSDTGVPITYACINSQATINFEPFKDINPAIKYTKFLKNGKTEFVASLLNGNITYQNKTEDISVDNNGNLRIKKASEKYEGVYNREIRNGGTITEIAVLKVFKPPSGPAKIKKRKDKAGKVHVYCDDPNDLGIPKADVFLQDSAGNTLSHYNHTVKDDIYKCCLVGESVTRCYHLDKCTVLRINETRDYIYNSTNPTAKECQQTLLCAIFSILSFTACMFVLFAFIFFTAKGKRNRSSPIEETNQKGNGDANERNNIMPNGVRQDESEENTEESLLLNGERQEESDENTEESLLLNGERQEESDGKRNRSSPIEETNQKENGENVDERNIQKLNGERKEEIKANEAQDNTGRANEAQDNTGRDDIHLLIEQVAPKNTISEHNYDRPKQKRQSRRNLMMNMTTIISTTKTDLIKQF